MGSARPENILQQLLEGCEGAVASVLMGFDGTAETYFGRDPQLEIDGIAREFTKVLSQVSQTADILQVGTLSEMTVHSDAVNLLIRVVDRRRFLGLAVRPAGNLGKGRFLLRMAASALVS